MLLGDKLKTLRLEKARETEVVKAKAIVRFDVEVETEVAIEKLIDGTLVVPPRDAIRIPLIDTAKHKISLGNCQAKFITFEMVMENEKVETEV
jgi:hypothetical protein